MLRDRTTEELVAIIYAAIVAVIAAGGLMDLWLALTGHETISEFLRDRPLLYIIPALLMVLFIIGLGLHLFVLRP